MSELEHLREVPDDGLEPAEYALHTLEKLSIVHYYLDGFDRACTRTKRFGGWTYVDSFAGSGHVRVRATNRIFEGSALIGLRSGASKVIAVEASSERVFALRKRFDRAAAGVQYQVEVGDANRALAPLMSDISPRTPVFVLHDPEGTELSWGTVVAVARCNPQRTRKPEQLINFTAGILRLLWVNKEIPEELVDSLDQFFGSSEWIELHKDRRAGRLRAHETLLEAVRLYESQLREVGYEQVLSREIRRENVTQGPPAYHLIFASDHDAAPRIMDAAFRKGFVGQLPMPGV